MTRRKFITFFNRYPLSITAALIALAFGVATYMRLDVATEKQQELDQLSTDGEKIFANVKNGVSLAEQVAILSAATKEIDARLIQSEELGLNLQYFYRLEAETGVQLSGTPRQIAVPSKVDNKSSNFVAIPFSLAIQGTTRQIMDFLGRLENGEHFVRFQSATLARVGTSNPTVLTLALQIELLGRT